jgi:hypothetical protein
LKSEISSSSSKTKPKMPIKVACQCGQRFAANDALAGKRVKCPKCGGVLAIPRPQPAASSGLDDLGALEAPTLPTSAPTAFGSAQRGAPAARSKAGRTAQPGFAAQPSQPAWPQGQTAWQGSGFGYQRPQPKKKGMSLGLILALVGGGSVLLLAIVGVVVVVVLMSGDSNEQVVVQPPPTNTPGPAAATSGSSASPAGTAIAADTSVTPVVGGGPTTSGPGPATGETTTTSSSPSQTPSQGPRTSDGRGSSSTSSGGATLASATLQWQAATGNAPRGVLPLKDEDLVFLRFSWLTQLLPLLGHQELYDKFDFNQSCVRDPNLTNALTVVPEFLNPADDRRQSVALQTYGMGLTHFAGMSGIEERNEVAALLPRSDPRAGVFGYDEVATPQQITDGTSQTIMIAGTGLFASPWVQGGGSTVRGARAPYFSKTTGFGSRGLSREGTFAVMADGSVRFIAADVDPAVFRAMCTIHGNDSVDQTHLGPQLNGFALR